MSQKEVFFRLFFTIYSSFIRVISKFCFPAPAVYLSLVTLVGFVAFCCEMPNLNPGALELRVCSCRVHGIRVLAILFSSAAAAEPKLFPSVSC